MDLTLPQELMDVVGPKYLPWINIVLVISFMAGRIYHAVVKGGGLKGIACALWLGTNTPTKAPADKP